MRRLHLVGFTSELDGLIFSANDDARSGGYVVALDSDLLDAIRDVLERRERHRAPAPALVFPSARPAQGSSLSPREIQARLRAGRRIEDVAMEAGVDDEWVRRFATPVFAERAHIAARAQAAVLEVDGRGPSAESLAHSVAANLADRGEPLTAGELSDGWDAYQLRETAWVVEFRSPVRSRDEPARWGFDTRTGRLTILNPLAAQLGWVGSDGPGRQVDWPIEERPAAAAAEAEASPPVGDVAEQLPLEAPLSRPARRPRAASPSAGPAPGRAGRRAAGGARRSPSVGGEPDRAGE